MIDIYADGGCFLGVCIPYDVMLDIMKGDFVKDSDFIEFMFLDGDKGAVRKRSITGFCESSNMEEA